MITSFSVSLTYLHTGKEPMFDNAPLQVVKEQPKNFTELETNTSISSDGSLVQFVDLPFVPIPARATFIEMAGDEKSYGSLGVFRVHYPPQEIEGKRAVILEINGDSMEPQLKHGSKVLAVEVPKGDWVYQAGKVYAIAFANQFVTKRIKDNDMLINGTLTLHSDNPNGGKFVVPADQIRSMWRVIEVVKSTVE
ncbi:S24 family peptidase [Pontibacter rugosus]|uniref:Helix-turn-helix transcriptional regulator n=1 Tax=Pontibacter rugosus TaxID=1745966 RepID=A0ABW3SJR1_9BACT